jgi:hypothetical protein
MSNHHPQAVLTPFTLAVTEAEVKATQVIYQPDYIIGNLLKLTDYLVDLVNHTNFFGPAGHDPYSPSLVTLYSRLQAGYVALSPLPGIAKDAWRLRQTLGIRLHDPIAGRPLEDFEDLYYAVLARMQDMMQTLNARLTSGFNCAADLLFANGPSITDLHGSLSEHWDMLNDPAMVRTFDDAVRQSRVNCLYEEINAELEANVITQADADKLLTDLFESKDTTAGIEWIGGWSPAMIGAWLKEKYRVLLKVEKDEDERQAREIRKRARMKVRVKKTISKSPTKCSSIEKMLEGMQTGFARLQDQRGGIGALRRGPGRRVRFVDQSDEGMQMDAQQVDKYTPIEAEHQGHNQHGIKQERGRQDELQRAREWQLKSQRVSDYSNYLRGAASHDARSVVLSTVYSGSVPGDTLGSSAPKAAEEDANMMEF